MGQDPMGFGPDGGRDGFTFAELGQSLNQGGCGCRFRFSPTGPRARIIVSNI